MIAQESERPSQQRRERLLVCEDNSAMPASEFMVDAGEVADIVGKQNAPLRGRLHKLIPIRQFPFSRLVSADSVKTAFPQDLGQKGRNILVQVEP